MSRISPELWQPVGVGSLEPTADLVVRSQRNALVVAGPGAGKTELLAQRACFLLDTGVCPAPRRILAISFKRDAAKNLAERVQKRCGDRAKRFDSFTLDAFAKSLVDRFILGLPEDWRPKIGYEVMTGWLRAEEMRMWLMSAGAPDGHSKINLEEQSNDSIRRGFDWMAHGHKLPYSDSDIHPLAQHWGLRWWREQLKKPEGTPSLSFPMLNRLAAFLLACNPGLTLALRATYGFVFLDEFQDTTSAQYDLVRTAFQGSSTILTAVGDGKQRIMLWAGAMSDVFDVYRRDFEAEFHHLVSNYRSAPELVQMQHVIAQTLEAETPAAVAAKVNASGSCAILEFSHPEDEAQHLAMMIKHGLREKGMKPRDFCILVRQRTGDMIEPLTAALASEGIRIRDESQLQDLLAEPVVKFLLAVLRLATRRRDAEAWDILTREVRMLFGLDENEDTSKVVKESQTLVQYAREALEAGKSLDRLPSDLVATIGDTTFRSIYPQYANGSYLNNVVNGLSSALQASLGTSASAREAVDDIIGIEVVPAMTIHKSKGLEFHSVIFLGLEDSQWWNFANQPDEEKRGFFVAFSRAVERVYFTFSDTRDGPWGRRSQHKTKINDLYTILQKAGVMTENLRN